MTQVRAPGTEAYAGWQSCKILGDGNADTGMDLVAEMLGLSKRRAGQLTEPGSAEDIKFTYAKAIDAAVSAKTEGPGYYAGIISRSNAHAMGAVSNFDEDVRDSLADVVSSIGRVAEELRNAQHPESHLGERISDMEAQGIQEQIDIARRELSELEGTFHALIGRNVTKLQERA